MVCMIWEPVETPEISAASPNFPTTIRSTAPYMACRNRASSTGSANRRSSCRILPCVKFPVSDFDRILLSFCQTKRSRTGQQTSQPVTLSGSSFLSE